MANIFLHFFCCWSDNFRFWWRKKQVLSQCTVWWEKSQQDPRKNKEEDNCKEADSKEETSWCQQELNLLGSVVCGIVIDNVYFLWNWSMWYCTWQCKIKLTAISVCQKMHSRCCCASICQEIVFFCCCCAGVGVMESIPDAGYPLAAFGLTDCLGR